MKYQIAIIIQGEGFGHITQAISLSEIIARDKQLNLKFCVLGQSAQKPIPTLLLEGISSPIYRTESPGLIYNKKNNRLSIARTVFQCLPKLPKYINSLRRINQLCNTEKIDIVINLYDLIGGLQSFFYKASARTHIAIAHQYFFEHPSFDHPHPRSIQRLTLWLNSKITSLGADLRIALTYSRQVDCPKKKIRVSPPLIRSSIKRLSTFEGNQILAYANQPYLMHELQQWHLKHHPDKKLHCFSKQTSESAREIHPNFIVHQINPDKFLGFMTTCRYIISSAGFETSCEAIYLNKQIAVIPIPGHYEQLCNSYDLSRSKGGQRFAKSKQINFQQKDEVQLRRMKNWMDECNNVISLALIETHQSKLQNLYNSGSDTLCWELNDAISSVHSDS